MRFCTDDEYERFLCTVPQFEKAIIDDGTILIKYWFEVSNGGIDEDVLQSGRCGRLTIE